jgi:hypothetical protein
MICTLDFSFELLVLSLVSMISTLVVFIDLIVLGKLIVPIENNYGFTINMISFSSFVIQFLIIVA